MELKPSGRVIGPDVDAALSTGAIVSSTRDEVVIPTSNGFTSSGRIAREDGSVTTVQSITEQKNKEEQKSRDELLASIQDKKERQAQGDVVAYTDAEEQLMSSLAAPTEIDWKAADAELEEYSPGERGKEIMRQFVGGSLPTDDPALSLRSIARDPDSRLAKTMQEYAQTGNTLSSAAQSAGKTKEEYYSEEVFPGMEDGVMKSFFQYAGKAGLGEEAFDSIVAIGKGMDYTGAAYTDALELFFSNMQEQSPSFYNGFMQFAKGAKMSPKNAAESLARETGNFITYLETLPVAGPIVTGLTTPMAIAGVSRKQAKELAQNAKASAVEAAKKFQSIETVRAAEKVTREAKREAAKSAATANANIQEQLIKEFEQELGARSRLNIDKVLDENLLISNLKDGKLTLDPIKYRAAAKQLLTERGGTPEASQNFLLNMLQPKTELSGVKGDIPDFVINPETGGLDIGIIRAENFEPLTAVASELMKKKGLKFDPKSGKRLIDVIFELSVDKEIMPEGELLGLLNKYDLSFEEYATMMVGSASEAGKVLNKLSQITRRVKSKSELNDLKEAQMLDMQSGFFKTFRRVEDIRRGLLVSQVATAMRNLSSAGVRAPLEGLQNVFDTALYNYSKDGLVSGVKSLADVKGNWNDSFRHMKYIFDPRNYNDVKEYTDYILDRPELSNQFDRMFNNLNEIRKAKGAGTGTIGDKALSLAEKGVDVLNLPNRWQENLIRRASFTAELERLVKREYGVELTDVINEGKLGDLLNDSPEFVTEGKASFKKLTSDAVDRALDITYAKQPELSVFREATSFITRNGLTTVAPFPRFMFNSMELAGEYGAGAFAPALNRAYNAVRNKTNFGPITPDELKKLKGVSDSLNETELALLKQKPDTLTGAEKKVLKKTYNRLASEAVGEFTAAERRMMSRNVIGVTVILPAAMMYRQSDEAPSDYKMLRKDDGTVLDTSAQSPILRQALWIAEYSKRKNNGTLDKWLGDAGYKEGLESFIGTNIRTGAGGVVFKDISDIFAESNALSGEKSGKYFGEAFGEYFSTYLTPINQVIETQRAFEFRPDEFLDLRKEPIFEPDTTSTFKSSFGKAFSGVFERRSMTTLFTPSEELNAARRESLFQEGDVEERVMPLLKVFTGLSLKEDVSKTGKFLMDLGFADYKIRSRSISPGFQRYETKVLREFLPSVVENVQSKELVDTFKEMAKTDKLPGQSVDDFVRIQQTNIIEGELAEFKSKIEKVIVAEPGRKTDLARSDLTTKDGKPIDIELTEYLQAQQQFRRLKPSARRAAYSALPYLITKFGDDVGLGEDEREPTMSNVKHIRMMIQYAKLKPGS